MIYDKYKNVGENTLLYDGFSKNLKFKILLDERLLVITDGDIDSEFLRVSGKIDMIFYQGEWYAVGENGELFWWFKDEK